MRKFFMLILVILYAQGIRAQDSGDDPSGPESGSLLFEITGTPFTGSSLLDFGQFRARYFLSDKLAVRMGMFMDLNNDQSTPDLVTNLSNYQVTPGIELHMRKVGGFTSYAHANAVVGQQFASRESTTGSNISGSTQVPSGNNYSFSQNSRGYLDVGLGLGVGGDYHFKSGFYIGAEIGFQLIHRMYSKVTVDGELYQDGTTQNTGSINTSNSIRVGFRLL